jgi:hypothetical protein
MTGLYMKAMSFGAEALSHQAEEKAEDHGWKLAKYFKLHLHPDDMKVKHDLRVERECWDLNWTYY